MIPPQFTTLSNNSTSTPYDLSELSHKLYARILRNHQNNEEKTPAAVDCFVTLGTRLVVHDMGWSLTNQQIVIFGHYLKKQVQPVKKLEHGQFSM